MKPFIKIKDLSVIYNLGKSNETLALSDINLEIYPQEYVIIYGPSGCGKSTLLYTITGLESPTYGEVSIDGKNLASFTAEQAAQLRRTRFGFIFQAYNLIPTLSVIDNIILPWIFHGKSRKEAFQQAMTLLKRFGISNQAQKLPQELSGGQQQRVGITRSLINDPMIILADEPIGNLDSISAKNVMKILKNLNEKDKKTIILVTHEPQYLHYAHRVLHMKDGRIVREVINSGKPQYTPFRKGLKIPGILEELARTYPYLSEGQLRAKALINYLFGAYEEPETHRLEEIIDRYISQEITHQQLEKLLDKSFQEGGLGLYKQTASKLAQQIDNILKISKLVQKGDKDVPFILKKYLLSDYDGILSPQQNRRLEYAIKQRLAQSLDKKTFEAILDQPLKEGGVGLNQRTARDFSRRLETVLINYE